MASQSEIFSRYSSLFQSGNITPGNSPTSKKMDNLDFIDFLFELVKSTKGQNEFKNIILKGVLSEIKNVSSINDIIKSEFIKKFGCNVNLIIPGKYTTESVLGITISKSEIDAFGLLGVNPNSKVGSFLYEGNDITKNVNYILYKSQTTNEKSPISFIVKNREIFNIYAKDSNSFIFKFGVYYKNKTFSLWVNDYLDAIKPFFNFVNFTTILTDIITGTISLSANKSNVEIQNQTKIITALQKIFGFCNENNDTNNTNGSPSQFLNKINSQNLLNGGGVGGFGSSPSLTADSNSDPFNFTADEQKQINIDSTLKSQGFIRFSTCGDLDVSINPNTILSGLDLIFNNADKTILNDYSTNSSIDLNELVNSDIYNNDSKVPNLNKTTDFFENAIKSGLKNTLADGETTVVINYPNINSEMQLNIIKSIPYALMQSIIGPKLLIIPKLFSVLSGKKSTDVIEIVLTSLKDTIKQIGSQVTDILIKNIFNSLKSDLVKLGENLVLQFIEQKASDYIGILRSLLSFLNLLTSLGKTSCESILDEIFSLLSLGNFGPAFPIPPPLVLLAGALKPGLNQVAINNDIKAALNEKGIETGATFPDGTPNHMIIAIQETVKVMTSHIKNNANISVTTVGTGLSQGYGQIQ